MASIMGGVGTEAGAVVWFVCKLCRRAFTRRKFLARHKRQVHPFAKKELLIPPPAAAAAQEDSVPPPSPPPLNLESFSIPTNRRCLNCQNFVYTCWPSPHKNARGEKDACRFCEKIFEDRGSRKLHEKNHEKNGHHQMATRCVLCEELFTNFSDLQLHQKICKNPPSWDPHLCRYCGTIFGDLASKQIHSRQEKPFACKICKKDFMPTETQKHGMTHYTVNKNPELPSTSQLAIAIETPEGETQGHAVPPGGLHDLGETEMWEIISKKKKPVKKSIRNPIKKTASLQTIQPTIENESIEKPRQKEKLVITLKKRLTKQ